MHKDLKNIIYLRSKKIHQHALKTLYELSYQLYVKEIDIKTAFLQGDSLKRKIFVKPLPAAECDFSILWKLNKCVYGLTDVSLMWYNRIIKFVTTCNSKVSKIDPALLLWHKDMNLEGFIICSCWWFFMGRDRKFETNCNISIKRNISYWKNWKQCLTF